MKIDTHVILLPNTNMDWWEECRKSLEGEPINLHIVDGVEGHTGKGRIEGFKKGDSPYISCIDPDDLVIPGAFKTCLEALKKNPKACGVYTDELVINETGKTIRPGMWSGRDWNPLLQLEPRYLHHVYVMRRRFVEKHLKELNKWPNLAEFILKGLLPAHGPWVHVNGYGYKWRQHGDHSHKKLPMMGLYAARWRIIPTLQRAAYKYNTELPSESDLEEGSS
jgi:hypothetical protein